MLSPISGTNANDVAFATLVKENAPVVVNSLPVGGHISHQLFGGMGKYTRAILHFPRRPDGYRIDVDASKDFLRQHKPSVVVFGKSLILFPEPVRELAPVAKLIDEAAKLKALEAALGASEPLSVSDPFVLHPPARKTTPQWLWWVISAAAAIVVMLIVIILLTQLN